MKFISFLGSLCLIILGCQHNYKTSSQIDYTSFSEKNFFIAGLDKELNQTDTLALISIKVPKNLDTFYHWHNTSDCLGCGRMQYRFADKHCKQFAESGFIWTYKPDSVCQLTIIHNPIKEAPDSIHIKPFNTLDTSPFSDLLFHQTSFCEKVKFIKKEFKEINGRTFIITAFVTPCSKITGKASIFLTAITSLKNRDLEFIGESSSNDTTDFIKKMYKSILSVKIKE